MAKQDERGQINESEQRVKQREPACNTGKRDHVLPHVMQGWQRTVVVKERKGKRQGLKNIKPQVTA